MICRKKSSSWGFLIFGLIVLIGFLCGNLKNFVNQAKREINPVVSEKESTANYSELEPADKYWIGKIIGAMFKPGEMETGIYSFGYYIVNITDEKIVFTDSATGSTKTIYRDKEEDTVLNIYQE